MTQEEKQQKAYEVYPLDLDRHMIIEGEPYDNNKERREAYIRGLTDSQPSLPSNLDEASRKYSDGENPACPCEECLIKSFKAGAEWISEQGWHEEAIIKGSDDIVWLNYNVELPVDLAKYFKNGDKVIVQIRKK